MATGVTYITTQGAILAAKTLESKLLKFSRFTVGDGTLSDTSVETIKALTGLVNPVLDFDITKITRETDTQVTVKGLFQNTSAEKGFYLKELGLIAIDPDSGEEVLFAYINYGDEAEYINNSISEKKEHYYDMVITVDNAENVEITLNPDAVYVTEKDLNELKSIVVANNAGAHNGIYRGKDITDLWYDGTLSTEIKNATFDDIYIGDYIIGSSSGRKYLVASLDYYLNTGDTQCTTHHVVMVPENTMGTAAMNSSSTTSGGYFGSKMYTTNLESYRTIIRNDFTTDHVLKHDVFFTNAVTSGYPSGATWVSDTDIELMNEEMVYGCAIKQQMPYGGTVVQTATIEKSQLNLFTLRPDLIVAYNDSGSRSTWWLRDVVSSSAFARVNYGGVASYSSASYSFEVRPAFSIF